MVYIHIYLHIDPELPNTSNKEGKKREGVTGNLREHFVESSFRFVVYLHVGWDFFT